MAEDRWRRPLIGPFTVAQVLAVVASIAAVAVLLVVLTSPLSVPPRPTQPRPGASFFPVGSAQPGLEIGSLAPEFAGTDSSGQPVQLMDLNGSPVRLADLRGKVVWINFWATWCPPCQEETPVLRDMDAEFADDGLEIVAISVQETTADDVRRYVDLYDLGYTVGFDATSAIFHTYHAFGLPTQLFVDRDGVIRQIVLGPVSRDEARSIVTGLLGIPNASPTGTSGSPTP